MHNTRFYINLMDYLMNMESMESVRQTLQLTGKGDWSSFLLQLKGIKISLKVPSHQIRSA
jgi:hypothetical protein